MTAYEVRVEWGVRRPDGEVVTLPTEDIARGFAASSDRFTLVSRVVTHIPWTADQGAVLDELSRLADTLRETQ